MTPQQPPDAEAPPGPSPTTSQGDNPAAEEATAYYFADDRIAIQVDAGYIPEVDAAGIAAVVAATLRTEGHPGGEVSVIITSDEAVAGLNQQFRGVAGPTDVLAFAAQEPAPGFVSAPEAGAYLGDVLIALPFTRRQAAEMGRDLADELQLLAAHGVLHLLGYDHAEPAEEAGMWARQDEILAASTANRRRT
jgi:probable rRNA maturation factor